MCTPVVLAIGVGSVLADAYAKYTEGRTQERLANMQSEFLRQQARDALQRGKIREGLQRIETSQLVEEQKLQYAGAGVLTDTGTPVAVAGYTRGLGELEAKDIENQAMREAWGYETNAAIVKYSGRTAAQAGNMAATTSLISGGFNLASGFYDPQPLSRTNIPKPPPTARRTGGPT